MHTGFGNILEIHRNVPDFKDENLESNDRVCDDSEKFTLREKYGIERKKGGGRKKIKNECSKVNLRFQFPVELECICKVF